jgi:hypothetical protein
LFVVGIQHLINRAFEAKTMAEHADKKPSTTSGGAPKKKWNNGRNKNTKRHASKPAMQPAKFRGDKEELDGNYFDCTGYGQAI